MNDTLEFPPIAAPALRTEVATAAAGALDLEKINLTDLALAKFGDWRGAVAAVKANLGSLALDLSTQARVNDAKSLRERLINVPRAEARKVSKALKSRLAATSKDVGAAEDQIVAFLYLGTAVALLPPRRAGSWTAAKDERSSLSVSVVIAPCSRMFHRGCAGHFCSLPASECLNRGYLRKAHYVRAHTRTTLVNRRSGISSGLHAAAASRSR